MSCIWVLVFIFYIYLNRTHKPAKLDEYDMDVSFQYSIGMGTGMSVIFDNGYECRYTQPVLNPPHCHSFTAPFHAIMRFLIGICTHVQLDVIHYK